MSDVKMDSLKLPSIPDVAREGLVQLYREEVDVSRLAQTIQKDAGICASVLKMANSVRYSSGGQTSDLMTAIGRIGLTSLMQILVSHSMESMFKFDSARFFNLKAFGKHSSFVGQTAFEFGKILKLPNYQELLIAGLMHDVGLAAMAVVKKDELMRLTNHCADKGVDMAVAERELKIEPHSKFGSSILKMWNFTETVQKLVLLHDCSDTPEGRKLIPEEISRHLEVLTLSDMLAHRFGAGYSGYHRDTRIDPSMLKKLQLNQNDVMNVVKNALAQLAVLNI